jgi:hypothetical protein
MKEIAKHEMEKEITILGIHFKNQGKMHIEII